MTENHNKNTQKLSYQKQILLLKPQMKFNFQNNDNTIFISIQNKNNFILQPCKFDNLQNLTVIAPTYHINKILKSHKIQKLKSIKQNQKINNKFYNDQIIKSTSYNLNNICRIIDKIEIYLHDKFELIKLFTFIKFNSNLNNNNYLIHLNLFNQNHINKNIISLKTIKSNNIKSIVSIKFKMLYKYTINNNKFINYCFIVTFAFYEIIQIKNRQKLTLKFYIFQFYSNSKMCSKTKKFI